MFCSVSYNQVTNMFISASDSECLTRLMLLFAEDYSEVEVRTKAGEEILRLLKADYFASYFWDASRTMFGGRVSINMDDSNLQAYDDYYQYRDPITFKLQSLKVPTLVRQVMPQRELERTEFFNDFLKKDGLQYGLNLFAYDNDINIGDMRVWRSGRREDFSQQSIEVLQMIYPAFARALARARRKQASSSGGAGKGTEAPLLKLSARERQIAAMIAQGLSDKQIAQSLNIEFSTVRTHVAHLFEKLGARNRAQVVAMLLAHGLAT